jgi:MFS family permease
MPGPEPRHDPYASLRMGDFRWFIASLLTMNIATQLQAVVVSWQVYALTRDPLSFGLIGLAEALPFIGFALPAGHVADRVRRLAVARVALAALLGCSLSLLWFTVQPGVLHAGRVWPIYLVIFLSGIARSFLQPARTALSAEVVPRHLYPNAVTWRSSTWQLAAVLGPALGGHIYGFGNAATAYVVDVALMVAALLAIARIAHALAAREPSGESVLESLAGGIRFVWGHPVVLGALALDLFSVLFGGATALLPVFADQILHVGPQGLGLLRAAPAVGAVMTSLWLAHRPPLRRAGRTLLINVALFGVSMIVFGLSRSFPLSQRHLHRKLKRDWRIRVRRRREAVGHGALGRGGWSGDPRRRGRDLGQGAGASAVAGDSIARVRMWRGEGEQRKGALGESAPRLSMRLRPQAAD